jgi:hypothetical protein
MSRYIGPAFTATLGLIVAFGSALASAPPAHAAGSTVSDHVGCKCDQ